MARRWQLQQQPVHLIYRGGTDFVRVPTSSAGRAVATPSPDPVRCSPTSPSNNVNVARASTPARPAQPMSRQLVPGQGLTLARSRQWATTLRRDRRLGAQRGWGRSSRPHDHLKSPVCLSSSRTTAAYTVTVTVNDQQGQRNIETDSFTVLVDSIATTLALGGDNTRGTGPCSIP